MRGQKNLVRRLVLRTVQRMLPRGACWPDMDAILVELGLDSLDRMDLAVALMKDLAMRAAIANWRKTHAILTRMEQFSRPVIFHTLPDTRRRKPLTKRVLWLN
jgi:hypothetical protein